MTDRYVGWPEVQRDWVANKHRSTVWRWIKKGLFPAPEQIGPNTIAWRESALSAWRKDDAAQRVAA